MSPGCPRPPRTGAHDGDYLPTETFFVVVCSWIVACRRQAERWTDVLAGREGSVSAVGPVALSVVSGLCLNKALSKSLRWRGGRRLTGGPSVGKQARSAQVSLPARRRLTCCCSSGLNISDNDRRCSCVFINGRLIIYSIYYLVAPPGWSKELI